MFFYQTLEILYFPDTRPSQLSSILVSVQKEDSGCIVRSWCGRRASPKNSPALPAGLYIIFFLLSFPNAGFSPFGNFFVIGQSYRISQIPRCKHTGHQTSNNANIGVLDPRGSRQMDNASMSAWLVARGNKARMLIYVSCVSFVSLANREF